MQPIHEWEIWSNGPLIILGSIATVIFLVWAFGKIAGNW